jgi:hypothetical protein
VLVSCGVCEVEFEAKRASARYCGDRCRQRAKRRGVIAPPADEPTSAPAASGSKPPKSALVDAVRKDLTEAKRLETVAGQSALLLAEQASTPGATGVAGLLKELRTVMAEALAGVPTKGSAPVKDQVAEARKRRDAKKARQAAHRA